MADVIFWDVDTQVDFIEPAGRLYVAGAEQIVPNLARLTEYARAQRIRILGDVDEHTLEDEEISEQPDFRITWPPHCMRGTPGQDQITATRARDPLYIENRPYTLSALRDRVAAHTGEVVIKKSRVDVFTQPNTNLLLEILQPHDVVVYGVALDVCVLFVVEGLLSRGDIRVSVVRDAVRAIDTERGESILAGWEKRGVRVVSTQSITGC